jgi:hypothetical protein
MRAEDDWLQFSGMFKDSNFNQNISNWQLRKYMEDDNMFDDCQIQENFKPKRVESQNHE